MKSTITYPLIFVVLFGLFFSISVNTICSLSKIIKNTSCVLENIDDDVEDNEESKKIELEDDFLSSEFIYEFASLNYNKHMFYTKSAHCYYNPYFSVSTPPPKC